MSVKKALLTIKNAERLREGGSYGNNRGATLLTALLAMLILSSVGLMITVTVAEDAQIAVNHHEIVGCLYICEAGLHYAVAKLGDDSSWSGLPAPGRAVGNGVFVVTVSDSTSGGTPLPGTQKRFNVFASLGMTEREIEVIVQ